MSLYLIVNENMKIEISDNVIEVLKSYRQGENQNEGGGILIGSYINDTKNIIIDKNTTPEIYDIRRKFNFYRSHRKHNKILVKIWKESNYTSAYLGEWHSHPQDYPIPSKEDYDNWEKLLNKAVYLGNVLLFSIVGRKKISFWIGFKRENQISELNGEFIYE